jgi:hypothetical protein
MSQEIPKVVGVALLAGVVVGILLLSRPGPAPDGNPSPATVQPSAITGTDNAVAYSSMSREQLIAAVREKDAVISNTQVRLAGQDRDVQSLSAELVASEARVEIQMQHVAALEKAQPSGEDAIPEVDVEQRLADLSVAFDDAFAAGDGDAVMTILREMRGMGAEAYPVKVSMINQLLEDREGDNVLELRPRHMYRSMGRDPEFYQFALQSEDASGALRLAAVHAMRWRNDGGGTEIFVEQLQVETDERVIAALAEQLGRRPTGDDFGSDSVSAIVEALDREYENGETAEALLFALAATHSDFSKEALNQYAQTAISADVSESLEAALRMASSPMAGLGVTAVSPNTQAASIGLEKGDVIVSFDGKTVNRRRQLIGMVRAADPETAVTIEYYRDGELNEAEVYGGYIGVGIMSIGRSAEQ